MWETKVANVALRWLCIKRMLQPLKIIPDILSQRTAYMEKVLEHFYGFVELWSFVGDQGGLAYRECIARLLKIIIS